MGEFSLEGKVALVTGGSRGIGEAVAIGFAKAGADVAVASRKIEGLEKVAGEIRKLGRKSLPVAAHLGHMEEIQPLVDKVVAEFGRIDILVNNAGTNPAMSSTLEMTERLWDAVMNLNLKGLFFISQAVARVMKERGGGNIINVASVDGIKPALTPEVGHVYCISKAGVIMATKVMALDLAPYHIRVNAIAPGQILTRLTASGFEVMPYRKELILNRTPMRRMGEPEEVVKAMIFLASDASSFVTGDTIVMDGGQLLT